MVPWGEIDEVCSVATFSPDSEGVVQRYLSLAHCALVVVDSSALGRRSKPHVPCPLHADGEDAAPQSCIDQHQRHILHAHNIIQALVSLLSCFMHNSFGGDTGRANRSIGDHLLAGENHGCNTVNVFEMEAHKACVFDQACSSLEVAARMLRHTRS